MHQVTLIPGDWIGPEVCAATQEIIEAAGVKVNWDQQSFDDEDSLIASCLRNKVVLKSRCKAPTVVGELPPTVALRKKLGLWAAVRPVKPLPKVKAIYPNLDLLIIRETSEDIYSGFEHEVTEGVFEAVKVTTAKACSRIARFAFEQAKSRNRKKLTIVHKSNIMKKSDGMFLRIAREIGKEYPEIETDEVIVDALCMWLVKNPNYFDVLLTLNLFGDIVSDLCAGLAGGITSSPSASHGSGVALFETLHGRAPELIGKDLANPIPMLNAATMMLHHLGETSAADRIFSSISNVLRDGFSTQDLGGDQSCSSFTAKIIDSL